MELEIQGDVRLIPGPRLSGAARYHHALLWLFSLNASMTSVTPTISA